MVVNKPTKAELLAAANKLVPDVIGPGLRILFCGINPGLYTAAIGYHFGRPGNRFWKALHQSGLTDRLLQPFEQQELLTYGYGITNLVARASSSAAELSQDELRRGGAHLQQKVTRYQPEWVAFLGIGAYRTAFGVPQAVVGKQDQKISTAQVWVLPNPSGLNAHYTSTQLAGLFSNLRLALEESSRP
jgi:double-stranded uracil-DNA glycosylase